MSAKDLSGTEKSAQYRKKPIGTIKPMKKFREISPTRSDARTATDLLSIAGRQRAARGGCAITEGCCFSSLVRNVKMRTCLVFH